MQHVRTIFVRIVNGNFGEPVHEIRFFNIGILIILFIIVVDDVLVYQRADILQIFYVGFDYRQHVFGGLALLSCESELNLYFFMDLLVLQRTESVRLGPFSELEIRVYGFYDPYKYAANTEYDVHIGVANVNADQKTDKAQALRAAAGL